VGEVKRMGKKKKKPKEVRSQGGVVYMSYGRGPREIHKAVCADCGQECEVPSKPDPSRPVYCRECWEKRRGARRGC